MSRGRVPILFFYFGRRLFLRLLKVVLMLGCLNLLMLLNLREVELACVVKDLVHIKKLLFLLLPNMLR